MLKVEVMREAMRLGSRVKWVKDLRMGLDAFGWQGLDMQALSGLSMNEVKHILKCMAWRRAREGWREEARARPKLEVMGRLMDCRCKARCVEVDCKRQRRMFANFVCHVRGLHHSSPYPPPPHQMQCVVVTWHFDVM